MPSAIVFDVFGTLLRSVDPFGPYFKLSKAIRSHSYLLKRHEMMTTSKSFADFIEEAGAAPDLSGLEDALAQEIASIRLFDDVVAYLDALKWRGYKVAVCSNLASDYGSKVRELLPAVDFHFFSYEIGSVKPDPAIYEHVLSKMGVPAPECLFAGDSQRSDVQGPRKVGMHSLLIERHRLAKPLHEQVDAALATLG
jgi:haloacid dehalogenase superfamily, subfamily IA, variant 3 with third motif having DD or ED/haloacid dehalogenase superfamily, subfamily IA, variant 1 with third motif having Dx(3-4)D or Dx(3-4)E